MTEKDDEERRVFTIWYDPHYEEFNCILGDNLTEEQLAKLSLILDRNAKSLANIVLA